MAVPPARGWSVPTRARHPTFDVRAGRSESRRVHTDLRDIGIRLRSPAASKRKTDIRGQDRAGALVAVIRCDGAADDESRYTGTDETYLRARTSLGKSSEAAPPGRRHPDTSFLPWVWPLIRLCEQARTRDRPGLAGPKAAIDRCSDAPGHSTRTSAATALRTRHDRSRKQLARPSCENKKRTYTCGAVSRCRRPMALQACARRALWKRPPCPAVFHGGRAVPLGPGWCRSVVNEALASPAPFAGVCWLCL